MIVDLGIQRLFAVKGIKVRAKEADQREKLIVGVSKREKRTEEMKRNVDETS